MVISEYNSYLVLAGKGNGLQRYEVTGDKLAEVFQKFERVARIDVIECFEVYTCNPETGEGGWDIHWVRGVRDRIQKYYPNFDCIITQGYPHHPANEVQEFLHFYKPEDDYKFGGVL